MQYPITIVLWVSSFGVLANQETGIDRFLKERFPPDLIFEKIVQPLPKLVVLLGSSVRIPCGIDVTFKNVTWSTLQSSVEAKNYRIDSKTGDLIIPQALKSDEKDYLCIIEQWEEVKGTREAIVVSATSVFVAAENDFWREIPSNLTVHTGSILRIKCSSNIYHEFELCRHVRLKFTFNHKPISTDRIRHSRYFLGQCGVLFITNMKAKDSGNYRCEARVIKTGQVFKSEIGHLDVFDPLDPTTTKEVDSNCMEQRCYLPPSPPVLLFHPQSRVVAIVGTSAILECFSNDVNSIQSVRWRKRVDDREMNLRRDGIAVDVHGILTIRNVRESDRGIYRCELLSDSSADMGYRMITLQVYLPPVLIAFPSNMEFIYGNKRFFNCSASGVPRPTVSIYKDGHPVSNVEEIEYNESHTSQIQMNTTIHYIGFYMIRHEHEGVYQCVAINSAGMTTKAIRMTVLSDVDAPSLPVDISIEESNATSVLVTWKLPESYNESSFDYNCQLFLAQEGKPYVDLVLESTILHHRYTGLKPDRKYSFYMRVIAIPTDGPKMHSSITSDILYHWAQLEHESNASVVLAGLLVNGNDKWLSVKWVPRYNTVSQKIQWWATGDEDYKNEEILHLRASQYRIEGLDPMAANVRVWMTIDPEENIPQRFSMSTRNPVRKRLDLHLLSNDSTSVLIDWTLPNPLNGMKFDYNLTYIDATDDKKRTSVAIADADRPFWIEKIDPGCYRFLLRVQLPPPSKKVRDVKFFCTFLDTDGVYERINRNSRTKTRVNQIYSYIEASDVTLNSALIKWITPENLLDTKFYLVLIDRLEPKMNAENLVRSEQVVSSLHMNDDLAKHYDVVKSSSVTVTETRVTLERLDASTSYRISVAPCSDKGVDSSLFPILFVTTLEGVPSTPLDFEWTALNASFVKVSWSTPEKLNGKLIRYQVQYSHNQIDWVKKNASVSDNSIVLAHLVSNTDYFCWVSGITAAGKGDDLVGQFSITAVLNPEEDDSISIEMIIVFAISTLVLVTAIILAYLLLRMCHFRRNSSIISGNPPQVLVDEDVKEKILNGDTPGSSRVELRAIHSIEMTTRHLDTKGRQNLDENVLLLQKIQPETLNSTSNELREPERHLRSDSSSSTSSTRNRVAIPTAISGHCNNLVHKNHVSPLIAESTLS